MMPFLSSVASAPSTWQRSHLWLCLLVSILDQLVSTIAVNTDPDLVAGHYRTWGDTHHYGPCYSALGHWLHQFFANHFGH